MEWKDCITWVQSHAQRDTDYFFRLVWKRLQTGDRTQDLQQTIISMRKLEDDQVGSSPEWEKALNWLSWTRSQKSDLMLDMIWKEVEAGNRSPELLETIRLAANRPAPAAIPEPEPPQPPEPPTKNF